MKILYFCSNVGFGHVTRSLYIVKELEKKGAKVIFCVGKPYDKFVREKGRLVVTMPGPISLNKGVGEKFRETLYFLNKHTPKFLLTAFKIKRIINMTKPDLVISDSEPLVPILNRKTDTIMLLHQPIIFTDIVKNEINTVWKKYLDKYCQLILVPDVIGLKIPKELEKKIITIGPLFDKINNSKKNIRKKLGIKKKTVLIIPSFATNEKIKDKIPEFAEKNKKWDFIILGQEKNEKNNNIFTKKKEDINPCEYIKASDIVVLSGYSSLMEAVYYGKPTLLIPTQLEQKKLAEMGEKSNILMAGNGIDNLNELIRKKSLRNKMIKNQKKFQKNGAEEAAEIIMGHYYLTKHFN